ncbi:MAG: hypothetical protein EXR50_02370 [Dehalococcoidia bacterium]|nr:hypothetical protein [Dehalococcoidia bacterium]
MECEYAFTLHSRAAIREGVSDEAIAAIKEGRDHDSFAEDMKVAVQLARELVRTRHVSDATFQRALECLGTKGMVQLSAHIGYWTLVCTLLNTYEMVLDPS